MENTEVTALDLKQVQAYLTDNEDGKKWLQSFTDAKVTKGISTYKEQTLPKLVEEEISKRYPNETLEQKQMKELQAQLDAIKNEAKREKLNNLLLTKAQEKNIPVSFTKYLMGSDEESTLNNITDFELEFQKVINKQTEEVFKSGGRTPAADKSTDSVKKYTWEEIARMPREDFKRLNPNQIPKN